MLKRAGKPRAMASADRYGAYWIPVKEQSLRWRISNVARRGRGVCKILWYIDDMEYARSFIESRKDKKSRKELYAALSQKGVEKELIEQALRNVMEMRIPGRQLRQFYRRKRSARQTMRKPRKYWDIWYAKASITNQIKWHKFRQVECLTSLSGW